MHRAAWLLALLLVPLHVAVAGRGDFDPNYGTGGQVTAMSRVLVLPDGSVLATERVADGLSVTRFDAEGQADPAFGSAGTLLLPEGFWFPWGAQAVATPDGGVLIAGSIVSRDPAHAVRDFAVFKLTAKGRLAADFGEHGLLTAPVTYAVSSASGTYGDEAQAVAVDTQGRLLIYVARFDDYYDGPAQVVIRRFEADGRRETGFGADMPVLAVPLSWVSGPLMLEVLDDGRICAVAHCFVPQSGFQVVETPPNVRARLADGGSLSGLSTVYGFRLQRLRPDGTVEPDFGSSGVLGVSVPSLAGPGHQGPLSIWRVVVAADDSQALVLGESPDGISMVICVRLNGPAPGSLDPAFGEDGITSLARWDVLRIAGIALQPGGGVLVDTHDSRVFRLRAAAGFSPGMIGLWSDEDSSSAATAQLWALRLAGTDGPASIAYVTADATAVAGQQYTAVQGRLDWAAGEQAPRSIQVPLIPWQSTSLQNTDFRYFEVKTVSPQTVRPTSVAVGVAGPAANPLPASPLPVATASRGGGGAAGLSLLLALAGLLGGRYVSATLSATGRRSRARGRPGPAASSPAQIPAH